MNYDAPSGLTWDDARNSRTKTAQSIPSLDELAVHRYDQECYEVASAIEQQWPHLKQDAGFYVHPKRGSGDHSWNIAPDGTIIDMTAEQFAPPQHPEIIRPTDPHYSRYVSWERHPDQAQSLAHDLGYHYDHGQGTEYPCPKCRSPHAGQNADAEPTPEEAEALGMNPDVDYCADCIDAYRNGIEPGGSACDERAHGNGPLGMIPPKF